MKGDPENLLDISEEMLESATSLSHELSNEGVVTDIVSAVRAIRRTNREQIVMFVLNLVRNGGKLTKAATDAGYGAPKNGVERTQAERNNIAKAEGTRLLKNEKIAFLYEKLDNQRVMTEMFKNLLSPWHLIMWHYALFQRYKDSERKSNVAVAAFQEIGKLAGYYAPDQDDKDIDKIIAKLDELSAGRKIAANLPYNDIKNNEEINEGTL